MSVKFMKKGLNFVGLLLAVLMTMLPVVQALSISNVQIAQVTDSSAHVLWTTDVPADSTVTSAGGATTGTVLGRDTALTTSHDVVLHNLQSSQSVSFKVASADGTQSVEDTNNGQFYSFTTASADTFSPSINVVVPSVVNSARIDISGTTESNTEVRLFVNGALITGVVTTTGSFSFPRVALATGQVNSIDITAVDAAGNQNSAHFDTTVDNIRPVITVSIPSVVQVASLPIVATISETAQVQVVVNDVSVFNQQTQRVEVNLPLEEGANTIIITATDGAGNTASEEATVITDTAPPEFGEVNPLDDEPFYYEGRAEDDVRGTTEAGARVFLFVQNNRAGFTIPNVLSVTLGTPNRPNPQEIDDLLKKAQYKTTADADGNFKLDDVNF